MNTFRYLIDVNHFCDFMVDTYGRKKETRYGFSRCQGHRTNLHARVAQGTGDKLKEIAQNLGYVYDEEGSTGQLLDALAKLIEDIANGEIILILSNKSSVINKNG